MRMSQGKKKEGISGRGSNIERCKPRRDGKFLAWAKGTLLCSVSRDGHGNGCEVRTGAFRLTHEELVGELWVNLVDTSR